jgi:hypothetical protein
LCCSTFIIIIIGLSIHVQNIYLCLLPARISIIRRRRKSFVRLRLENELIETTIIHIYISRFATLVTITINERDVSTATIGANSPTPTPIVFPQV